MVSFEFRYKSTLARVILIMNRDCTGPGSDFVLNFTKLRTDAECLRYYPERFRPVPNFRRASWVGFENDLQDGGENGVSTTQKACKRAFTKPIAMFWVFFF